MEVRHAQTMEIMRDCGYKAIHLLQNWVFVAETDSTFRQN
jgi:hypothetical protein